MALRAQVHRVGALKKVVVSAPAAHNLGRQRGRRPRVHHVGLAHEAAGLAALVLGVSGSRLRRRVHRQLILARRDRCVPLGFAIDVNGIPDRDRHAKEALTRHEPVASETVHPVLVALAHVGGDKVEGLATLKEAGAKCFVTATVGDVPLARGDDLERAITLFVELDRVGDGLGLALHHSGFLQHLDNALLSRKDCLASEFRVRGNRVLGLDARGRLSEEAPVPADDGASGQLKFTPPHDVGHIAERANHRDAGALVGRCEVVRHHRHLDIEQWGAHVAAKERLVTLIIGVRDKGDACGQELGTRRLDEDRLVRAGRLDEVGRGGKGEAVICAGTLAVFKFGLRNGGAERDVPQRRRFCLVGLAARKVAQECLLRDCDGLRRDRLVRHAPIDREAKVAPQFLELCLVFRSEPFAQLDEVASRDRHLVSGLHILALGAHMRRLKVGHVRKGRVAAHAKVVLHAPLRGKSVVVPPHRIEDLAAAHPLETRHNVGVGVREHVTHVEGARDGGRGSVDRVDLLARLAAIKVVDAVALPYGVPAILKSVDGCLVRDA